MVNSEWYFFHSLFATRYSPTSFLQHWARGIGRTEGVVAGDFCQDLVIVPRIFALVGLLDLDHHQIVGAQLAVPRKEILDRLLAHPGRHLERLVGAGFLDRVEIMHHR